MKPLFPEVNGTRNRILGHLPSKDFQRLRQRMKLVELPLGTSLSEPYAPLKHVYFPEDGVASLLTRLWISLPASTGFSDTSFIRHGTRENASKFASATWGQ